MLVVVIAEDLTRAGDENFILGQSLCSVPPLSDGVRQNDTERERVDEQNVFASAVSNEPLRQRNTDTETLFAIRVAVLKEVVTNLLVGESFERLCDIYPVVVDGLYCDVFCRVLASLVGMQGKRQSSIMLLDGLLVRVLVCELASLSKMRVAGKQPSYPRNTQHLVGIPYVRRSPRGNQYEIDHSSIKRPSSQHDKTPLYPPLEPLLLLALSLDEVGMFGGEVGLYPRSSVLEF